MAYIDKSGALRNSEKDLNAFTAYCRERVKLMKNSDAFIKKVNDEYDIEFDKKSKEGSKDG